MKTILFTSRLLSVQYAVFLHGYLNEWRKNPHWSFSCCLALLLPLNDLQGEIRGIAGTNILENQLQTGQIDKPTILSAVKNSGAIDVTLEEGEQGNNNNDNDDQAVRSLFSDRALGSLGCTFFFAYKALEQDSRKLRTPPASVIVSQPIMSTLVQFIPQPLSHTHAARMLY